MTSSSSTKQHQLDKEAFTSILDYLQEADTADTTTASLATNAQKLNIKDEQPATLEEKVDAYCKEFLYIGGPAPRISRPERKTKVDQQEQN